MLDCFCYTGGFTVNAPSGGAVSVLSLDSSSDALALCRENVSLNQLPADRHAMLAGDVFHLLRKFRDEGRSFDMIILDPPKFAPTAAQAEKAARGYKDINLFAFKLLRPGGLLVTFSCSGGVDAGLFQKIVAGAALDAGVDLSSFDRYIYVFPQTSCFPSGTGTIGGSPSETWINGYWFQLKTVAHEVGHNLGLFHANVVTPVGPKLVSLSGDRRLVCAIDPSSGVFRGSFVDPGTGITNRLQGVVLPKQDRGVGYLRGTNQTGWLRLETAHWDPAF